MPKNSGSTKTSTSKNPRGIVERGLEWTSISNSDSEELKLDKIHIRDYAKAKRDVQNYEGDKRSREYRTLLDIMDSSVRPAFAALSKNGWKLSSIDEAIKKKLL